MTFVIWRRAAAPGHYGNMPNHRFLEFRRQQEELFSGNNHKTSRWVVVVKPSPSISLKVLRAGFEEAIRECFIAEDDYRAQKETSGAERTHSLCRRIKARSRMNIAGCVYAIRKRPS